VSDFTSTKRPEDWVQVEASQYLSSDYLNPPRLASIGYQLRYVDKHFPAARVLEIGVGAGLTADLMRRIGCKVTTLDVDANLNPDLVSSVTEIPAEDGAFDAFTCCQVLEHLKWEDSCVALRELRRVTTKGGVLSIPTVRPRLGLRVFPYKRNHRTLMLPGFWPRSRSLHVPNEHYWELGLGVSMRKFDAAVRDVGFRIVDQRQPIENPFHHFFVVTPS
jgi:SAM-dependent methyltransferase